MVCALIVIVLAIVLFVAVWWSVYIGEKDVTSEIREDLTRNYVLTIPMFIVDRGGKTVLETNVYGEGGVLTLEEYRANPDRYPSVIDGMPAGTMFRVRRGIARTVFAAGPYYDLEIEVLAGKYEGRVFTMGWDQIMYTRTFRPFVKLAPPPGETKKGKQKPLTPGPPTHGHAESGFLSAYAPSAVLLAVSPWPDEKSGNDSIAPATSSRTGSV